MTKALVLLDPEVLSSGRLLHNPYASPRTNEMFISDRGSRFNEQEVLPETNRRLMSGSSSLLRGWVDYCSCTVYC